MIGVSVSLTAITFVSPAPVAPGNSGKVEHWTPQGELPMSSPDGKGSGKFEHWPKNRQLPPVLSME